MLTTTTVLSAVTVPGMNFSSKEANELQGEIETITKNIEHEKINYRLCEERHKKQLENYNILCGKPNQKNKDKKDKDKQKNNKQGNNKTDKQDINEGKIY